MGIFCVSARIMISLCSIEALALEDIYCKIEYTEYIESRKSEGNTTRTERHYSICCNVVLDIERLKIGEYSQENSTKKLC